MQGCSLGFGENFKNSFQKGGCVEQTLNSVDLVNMFCQTHAPRFTSSCVGSKWKCSRVGVQKRNAGEVLNLTFGCATRFPSEIDWIARAEAALKRSEPPGGRRPRPASGLDVTTLNWRRWATLSSQRSSCRQSGAAGAAGEHRCVSESMTCLWTNTGSRATWLNAIRAE